MFFTEKSIKNFFLSNTDYIAMFEHLNTLVEVFSLSTFLKV